MLINKYYFLYIVRGASLGVAVLQVFKGCLSIGLVMLTALILGTSIQRDAWAERFLVSFLSVGGTSSLDYARKFIDMPITIIMSIGATVMTPILATIWAKEGKGLEFARNYFIYLRLAFIVISPIVFLFSICSTDIILLLLNRGNFEAQWLIPTAQTLKWFGIGLYGVVFYVISGQSLLVQGRSIVYASIGVGAQILPIIVNVLLYKKFGLSIFGFSWCIAQIICGFSLLFLLKIKEKKLFIYFLFLVCVLLFNMLLGYMFLQMFHFLPLIWKVVSALIFYFICVFVFFAFFKFEEFQTFKKVFTAS